MNSVETNEWKGSKAFTDKPYHLSFQKREAAKTPSNAALNHANLTEKG